MVDACRQSIDVIVAGCGVGRFCRYNDGSTPRDWVRQVARDAIADAGLVPEDIESLVIATESDFFSLQICPGGVLVDDLGLVPRPVIRVEMGGATGALGIHTGAMQILSGMYRIVLVIGFEHAASHLSGTDMRMLYGLSFDADIEGMAGATAASLYALSIVEHMRVFGTTEDEMAMVSVKNHGNAIFNPLAHKPMEVSAEDVLKSPQVSTPYKVLDCSMISDGAGAVILMDGRVRKFDDRARVRVAGFGCASDHVRLGDRSEPFAFRSKVISAQRAYAMAGITDPARQVDVAEVYDAFTGAELQGIEALALCKPGAAGKRMVAGEFSRDGRTPVNLSGGLIGQGGPPGATGVVQIITLTRVLQGAYWPELQPQRDMRFGLADAHAGVASVSVTHVLERLD